MNHSVPLLVLEGDKTKDKMVEDGLTTKKLGSKTSFTAGVFTVCVVTNYHVGNKRVMKTDTLILQHQGAIGSPLRDAVRIHLERWSILG